MLYTGITRAKELLLIVGTNEALKRCVTHVPADHRNTMLKDCLRDEQARYQAKKLEDSYGKKAESRLSVKKTDTMFIPLPVQVQDQVSGTVA